MREEYFGETCGACGRGRIMYVKLIYPLVAQIIAYCEHCGQYRRMPLSKTLCDALGFKRPPPIWGSLLGLKR